MPSGARKRKAAKKKKEKETNTNPSTNNPQGNTELKSQDEKGNDGGEGGYYDHDDSPFIEGIEEVEESDPSALQPSAADAKPIEGKQDVVMVEQGLESGESCESKNVSGEQLESVKGSDYGNGNSGGLNDETVAENSKDEPYNSVKESVAFDDLVKSKDETVIENSKDEPYNSVKETVPFDDLVRSIDASHAKMTLIAENAPVGETGNSLVESPAVASISEVKSSDTGNALPEKSVASQVGPIDLAMKKNEDKVYPFSDDTEHVKDSDRPECSGKQPLITTASRVVQKTSWLNCCGLFEVLTGSNR